MSYIGRGIDQIDNISTLDNLSFNGSDATFNLTQNSVAFVPVSADALQIQIDGVIQANNFTISGSTVTFDFIPNSGSVCNSIKHFGVGLLTTVSDGAVTEAKIGTGAVTNAKLGADSVNGSKIADNSISDEHLDITAITGQTEKTSLADADKFLISDSAASGALKYVQNSNLGGGAWNLIYSDNVSGMGSGSNAYSNSNLFSSTYDFYRVYILNWEPQNDSVDLELQFTIGGVLRTSDYKFNLRREESLQANTNAAFSNGGGAIRIMEGCGNATGESMSGWFEYQNPTGDNGNWYNTQCMYGGIESNGYTIGGVGQGTNQTSTGAITGFTIKAHSGGLGNYNLRAYGLKTS